MMLFILAFLTSLFIGFALITIIFSKNNQPSFLLKLPLAYGLGFGISASICFLSLVLFNQIVPLFIFGTHVLVILGLCFTLQKKWTSLFNFQACTNVQSIIGAILLLLLSIPLILFALSYPNGGWDAWSCWNLKARFIFLGGESWSTMFDPLLWRTNPAYPFLLPLINVWSWLWTQQPLSIVPLIHSVTITIMTMVLLWQWLQQISPRWINLLPALLPFSIWHVIQLAGSQCVDIWIGYFLLAALGSFITGLRTQERGYFILFGIFLGLISFTKNEGIALAGIMACGSLLFLGNKYKHLRWTIIVSMLIASLPTILFKLLFHPEKTGFINGFISTTTSSTWERLHFIFDYFTHELIDPKWNFIWVTNIMLLIATLPRMFKRSWILIPFTLSAYLTVLITYYQLNTFFEINWWLQVTLDRIFFALIPIMSFWAWGMFLEKTNTNETDVGADKVVG